MASLERTQLRETDRGQNSQRSAAVPQAAADLVYYQLLADQRGTIGACGSPTTPPPTRSTSTSPATRSRQGRTTLQASTPPSTSGFIAPDWKDGRLVGIEILDASTRLHHHPSRPSRNHRLKRQPLDRQEPLGLPAIAQAPPPRSRCVAGHPLRLADATRRQQSSVRSPESERLARGLEVGHGGRRGICPLAAARLGRGPPAPVSDHAPGRAAFDHDSVPSLSGRTSRSS
jgi:hypothetical protein